MIVMKKPISEYDNIRKEFVELKTFTNTTDYYHLDSTEKYLILRQLDAMEEYMTILEARITHIDIRLKVDRKIVRK